MNDIKNNDVPIFKISNKNEKVVLKTLSNYKKGKVKIIEDWDKYVKKLFTQK